MPSHVGQHNSWFVTLSLEICEQKQNHMSICRKQIVALMSLCKQQRNKDNSRETPSKLPIDLEI